MKRTVIVNLPMNLKPEKTVYVSTDKALPALPIATDFPVISYLSSVLQPDDEVSFIMIAKTYEYSISDQGLKIFQEEMEEANTAGAKLTYDVLVSSFREEADIHEKLMKEIVSKIEDESTIVADITYGPKDVPILVFAVLNFAENLLGCDIEHILYGQALFDHAHEVVETRLCDMIGLYTLSSLTNSLKIRDSKDARKLLDIIIPTSGFPSQGSCDTPDTN